MKKLICRILCATLALCALLTLSACGVAGKYTLTEVSYSGNPSPVEDTENKLGESYIQMNTNGTAILCLDGNVINMEWKDGKIWGAGEEGNTADFEIKNSKLTLYIEGIEMVFSKD